jgi:hypothetical protein
MRALAAALVPGGGLGAMLYGELGRRGVYEAQDALRALAPAAGRTLSQRLETARRLLRALPDTHWLKRDRWRWRAYEAQIFRDDALLADLVLPGVDVAFRVGEVAEMVARSGLVLSRFWQGAVYDPATWLGRDPELRAALDEATSDGGGYEARCALAEALAGNMHHHYFYAIKPESEASAGGSRGARAGAPSGAAPPLADAAGAEAAGADEAGADGGECPVAGKRTMLGPAGAEDVGLIPVPLHFSPWLLAREIRARAQESGGAPTVRWEYQGTPLEFEIPPLAVDILEQIDGRTTVRGIFARLVGEEALSRDEGARSDLAVAWTVLFERLHGFHRLFLSARPVVPVDAAGDAEAGGALPAAGDEEFSFDYFTYEPCGGAGTPTRDE